MPGIGIGISTFFSNVVVPEYNPNAAAHIARVETDGGVIDSPALCNDYFVFKAANSFMTAVIVDAFPHVLGYKEGATSLKCSKLYGSAADGSGDIAQSTAVSQPLLLRYNGSRYLYSPGITNNNINTPAAPANDLSGTDFELIFKLKIDSVQNSPYPIFFAKYEISGVVDYLLYVDTGDNKLYLQNLSQVVGSASIAAYYDQDYYYKVTYSFTANELKFYTSPDGVVWTQSGTTSSLLFPITNTAGQKLYVGDETQTDPYPFKGKIYSATIAKSIGGVPVVSIDLANYNAAVSETSWTSFTGETWTLSRPTSVTANYSATIITRTTLLSNGSNTMVSPVIGSPTLPRTNVSVFQYAYLAVSKGLIGADTSNQRYFLYNNGGNLSFGDGGVDFNIAAKPDKRAIVSLHKTGGINSKAQLNAGSIITGDAGVRVPASVTIFTAESTVAYSGCTEFGGLVEINAGLSDSDILTLKDFINDTLFNGEIY